MRGIEGQICTPECQLDKEQGSGGEVVAAGRRRRREHVTNLTCITGDKVKDLGEYKPTSFARCRFAPRTFVPEPDDNDNDEEEEEGGAGCSSATVVVLGEIEARRRAIKDGHCRRSRHQGYRQ